jgi:hypothetical protein
MSITPATFDRAEFHSDPPPPDSCAICQRGLATEYFRVGGHLACRPCADQAQSVVLPDSHKAYSRALLFGIGAAIAGCVGYTLMAMTGFMIGYVAIGVGWLVGKAMKAGSHGRGGRRYQITAALLTYAAISMSFVPIAIRDLSQHGPATTAAEQHAAEHPGSQTSNQTAPQKPAPLTAGGFLKAIAILFGIGLISPFLMLAGSFGHGLFGLFFLFIGIQTAVVLTKKHQVEVDGPFESIPASA